MVLDCVFNKIIHYSTYNCPTSGFLTAEAGSTLELQHSPTTLTSSTHSSVKLLKYKVTWDGDQSVDRESELNLWCFNMKLWSWWWLQEEHLSSQNNNRGIQQVTEMRLRRTETVPEAAFSTLITQSQSASALKPVMCWNTAEKHQGSGAEEQTEGRVPGCVVTLTCYRNVSQQTPSTFTCFTVFNMSLIRLLLHYVQCPCEGAVTIETVTLKWAAMLHKNEHTRRIASENAGVRHHNKKCLTHTHTLSECG